MLRFFHIISIVCFAALLSQPSEAQLGLTGSALISQLESTGKSLISQGETSGSNLIRQMGEHLQTLSAQLKQILGDQVTKPINDLNDNLKVQAQRAVASLQQSEAFIDSEIGCSKQDIEQLSAAAAGSIKQFASDAVPWAPDFPYVTGVSAGGQATLLGFRIDSKPTDVTIKGSNLADPRCDPPTVQLESQAGQPTGLSIISSEPDSIVAVMPKIKDAGLYRLRIRTQKKGWFWCKPQPEATASINILPPAQFAAEFEASPICKGKEQREFLVGGFGRTNSSCDNNADDSQTVSLKSVTKDGSDDWVITSDRHQDSVPNDHCSNIGPNGQGYNIAADGKSIQIGVSCSPRSGKICIPAVGCSCSGGGTGHTFSLWVTAQRNTESSLEAAKGSIGPIMGFGSTSSTSLKPFCDFPIRYTVKATGIYPDGSRQDFPSRTESATIPIVIARGDGFTIEWNPADRQVAATTPKNTCRGIY